MAEKRMFTQKIIDSDAFLEMPLSAQALYFHLNMRADDDGFVNNPKKITNYVNASADDLKLLLLKRFIIGFDSGVIVIKHWRMHNTLKADRYKPTDYQDELAKLGIKSNKAYTDHPELPPAQNPEPEEPQPPAPPLPDPPAPEPPSKKEDSSKVDPDFEAFAAGDKKLLDTLEDFAKMRVKIKAPLTDRAKVLLFNKLGEYPREQWIPLLEQSILNSWRGIFPLHDVPQNTKATQPNRGNGQSSASAMLNLMKGGAFGDPK